MKIDGKRYFHFFFFTTLFALTLFLSLYRHWNTGTLNWKTEIYADKAGYYAYLPSLLFYGFDPVLYPDSIEQKAGYGFEVNTYNRKVFVKYTYGVSLLISPFFFATHFISLLFDIPEEGGFSVWYHRMANIPAAVYLVLGLMLLKSVLSRYVGPVLQYLLLLIIFSGTNLLYFSYVNTLMSHVYSFFLFALFIFALQRFFETKAFRWYLILALAASLVALVRPVNAVLWLSFLFLDAASWKEIQERMRLFLKPRYFLSFGLILFIVFLPQMIYWKWAWGTWIHYSYGTEGFHNWVQPHILGVWFSPKNGLFIYSPITIMMVAGMVYMIRKRMRNGLFLLLLFLFTSYLFSSWDNWYFGCSFGYRPFVEYYTLFIIPLGFLIRALIASGKRIWLVVFISFMVLSASYTVISTISYPGCYQTGEWDFTGYKINLAHAGIIPGGYIMKDTIITPQEMTASMRFSGTLTVDMQDFQYAQPDVIRVVTRFRKHDGSSPRGLDARIVCTIVRNDSMVYYRSAQFDSCAAVSGEWANISVRFRIPAWIRRDTAFRIYCWNRSGDHFMMDRMKVMFKASYRGNQQ